MSKVGTKSKVSKHFYKDKRNAVITSDIWDRDKEYPKQFLPHVGYDYRASVGTELVSPFDGEVISVVSELWSSYGRQIFILKSDGTVTAHFAHLSRVNVKQGQKVRKGDLIGLSGGSGATENTYAPHLHLGLAKGRVTTTTKGKALGDIWLDVELYDFNPLKPLAVIAKEVLDGKWGNGEDRKNRLTKAGYDYNAVQAKVNEILNVKPKPTLRVGSKVKITGTRYATGQVIPTWVKKRTHTVQQITKDRVLLKEIQSWVYRKDVEL